MCISGFVVVVVSMKKNLNAQFDEQGVLHATVISEPSAVLQRILTKIQPLAE
jgi:hypothetical protein